jgi:outer membrane protein OmpA-like peptidoglycan-associated protein
VLFRGFTLIFNEGTMPLNRGTVIASIEDTLGIETIPSVDTASPPEDSGSGNSGDGVVLNGSGMGMELISVPEGIRLVVKDIRFIPDSDEFLPEERHRLDIIAQALRPVVDRSFLVEGHTAAIGDPTGDMDLSIRRAKRMVDELIRRGISEDRFIYKGWGGTKPIGDNLSEEGRSRNRRVEITILE